MADECRVYVDSCSLVDMVKTKIGRRLDSDRERDVWYLKRLLEASRDKEIEVYTSTITVAECSHGGDNDISETVKSAFTAILTSGQYVRLVQTTPFIAIDARDLRWKYGISLKGADAIHVASAIDRRCEEFLTSDGRLLRLGQHRQALSRFGLEIRAGRETQCLPDKYRQLKFDDEAKSS